MPDIHTVLGWTRKSVWICWNILRVYKAGSHRLHGQRTEGQGTTGRRISMGALPIPRPTDYLEQFDAAAAADKYPLVRRWIDSEPLPFFKELREKRPILVTPVCTLLTRFDDVT